MTCSRGSSICLYVFSGPHLGACVELTEGSWVVGSDDACDIILTGLAPRHAVLDISSGDDAFPVLAVTALDGPLRLQGEDPVAPGEADAPLHPAAGSAWYLGTTCFAWNRPGIPQESLVPELSPRARTAGDEEAAPVEAGSVPVVAATSELLPTANDLGMDAGASETLLPDVPESIPARRVGWRALLLVLVAVFLLALSLMVRPADSDPDHYPEIIKKYLEDAGIRGLAVTRRDPGVEIRGTVADDAAMIRLRDMARGLHIPVYMEVAVQEDMLRAVRSSLGIRGFHPDVVLWENKGNPRLQIRAYMKDELLETAAFTALKAEVRGLPVVDRHIVYEKDLAPVLDAALQREGLGNVRVIYLPGRVDFSGDFRPEDTKKLDAIRQDASELFGVRLHGTSSASGALAAAERSLTPSRDGEPTGAAPARPSGNGGGDPLGGLRVTGVTMSPMRFVTTADGRRLFEGAVLPSGWTLESIDTKVLVLRNGSQVVSHRLRGK